MPQTKREFGATGTWHGKGSGHSDKKGTTPSSEIPFLGGEKGGATNDGFMAAPFLGQNSSHLAVIIIAQSLRI